MTFMLKTHTHRKQIPLRHLLCFASIHSFQVAPGSVQQLASVPNATDLRILVFRVIEIFSWKQAPRMMHDFSELTEDLTSLDLQARVDF